MISIELYVSRVLWSEYFRRGLRNLLNLIRILSEKLKYIVFNKLVNGNAENFKLKKVYSKDFYQV